MRADGTVHYVGVQLGRDLGPSIEIVSGLAGDERLVVNVPNVLKEPTPGVHFIGDVERSAVVVALKGSRRDKGPVDGTAVLRTSRPLAHGTATRRSNAGLAS